MTVQPGGPDMADRLQVVLVDSPVLVGILVLVGTMVL